MPELKDAAQQGKLFFQSVVNTYTTNPRFMRRDWLANEVEARLADPGCRFVLLTAEPGAGKSAFMAQLASDHNPRGAREGWPRYFIRRDQWAAMGDVGSRAFLLGIGFQLAALHPELFALEQLRITVEQRVGDVEDRATVIGAEIDKIIISPFHQVVLRIQQEVHRVGGQVTGLHIGEWVADPQSLTESQLQNMALFDPARALAQ